ncbi:HAL/PAL/TAL family ammonia-lyase [Vibrio sp. WJH972]
MNTQSFSTTIEHPTKPLLVLGSQASLMTSEQIYQVAHQKLAIELDHLALARVKQGHNIVLQAIRNNQPIYGLTVGVGWNKDKLVFAATEGEFDALLEVSRQHNLSSLRAHAAGVGKPLCIETVRAAMLIRVNMMLTGSSGVQPAVTELLCEFLKHGITPIVPGKGSMGKADITQNAHIGLALIGEWDVLYQDQRMPAKKAMELVGLKPVKLVGKDFLAIVSSNNITAARLALAIEDIALFIERLQILFPLALEGMNGNLTPFIEVVTSARPYSGMKQAAKRMCHVLQGSDLWVPDPRRHLQDSLSLREIAYTLGQLVEAHQQAYTSLSTHINHSDDNPLVVLGKVNSSTPLDVEYQVQDEKGIIIGSIFPSANYDGQPLAIATEHLLSGLRGISNVLATQLVETSLPQQTGLPRFLAHSDNNGHAFGALQKPMIALDKENQFLASTVSLGHSAMAGGIEDVGSFGMLAIINVEQIMENLYEMASLHLLHVSQAIDLRPKFKMSSLTRQLLVEYRKSVPIVTKDRIFTIDISAGVKFLRHWEPNC